MMPENVPVSFGVPSKCIVISTLSININKNDSEASIKPILAVVRAFCCFQDTKMHGKCHDNITCYLTSSITTNVRISA